MRNEKGMKINEAKIAKQNKTKLVKTKGKQALFFLALKRNKKYGSQTKRKNIEAKWSEKENTEAKNEAKRNMLKQNEAKR
jgi:hypothetical protein